MKLRLEGRPLLEFSVRIGVLPFFLGARKQASKQSSLFDVPEGRHTDR
jgi:hypothetical protein